VLWLACQLAARRYNLCGSDDHISHLETQACPGPLPFPTSMDTDDAITDLNIGDGRILPDHLSAKDGCIELHGPNGVGRPDDVFESFDLHGLKFAPRSILGNIFSSARLQTS